MITLLIWALSIYVVGIVLSILAIWIIHEANFGHGKAWNILKMIILDKEMLSYFLLWPYWLVLLIVRRFK